MPPATGVYYLHNAVGDIIYIGKSKNIQKRVRAHPLLMIANPKKFKKLHKINFETTGSELIALLKEQHEIKKNQPQINKDGRYRLYPMGIRIDRKSDYHQLVLEQVRNHNDYIVVVRNGRVAKNIMMKWMKTHQFCHKHSSSKIQMEPVMATKTTNAKALVWVMNRLKTITKDSSSYSIKKISLRRFFDDRK